MKTGVTSLILRFRDLSTNLGQTIEEHRKLIRIKGSTWWGWWSKDGEKIPSNLFQELQANVEKSGILLYLYDSGQQLLYEAKCTEIQFQHRTASPEKDLTPSYYNDIEYNCWFRFTRIVQKKKEKEILNRHSYIEIKDFFEEPEKNNYEEFNGKRICSFDELHGQQRSIWFIRDCRPEDPTQEIILTNANRIKPSHFPQDFQEKNSNTLVWLSDLHCSYEHYAFEPDNSKPGSSDLFTSLKSALEKLESKTLAGVIVTGDLTWQAKKEEFDIATKIFKNMKSQYKLDWYDFAICPGNHDLAFSDDPSVKTSEVKYALSEARDNYDNTYKELFFIKPCDELCSGRKYLLRNLMPIEIVMLNSSTLQQQEGGIFQGHGFIGKNQLEYAATNMGWVPKEEKRNSFRIVGLHHHVMPVTSTESLDSNKVYSVVLDAEAFIRWVIRYRVNLVLHGHMHQPYHATIRRDEKIDQAGEEHEFDIVGLGSTGAKSELGEVAKNTFGLIDFSSGSCEIRICYLDAKDNCGTLYTIPIQK